MGKTGTSSKFSTRLVKRLPWSPFPFRRIEPYPRHRSAQRTVIGSGELKVKFFKNKSKRFTELNGYVSCITQFK